MRVYYNDHSYIDFKDVTHWSAIGDNWVELMNEQDEIKAVLNWQQVWLMRPLDEKEARIESF